MTRRSFFDMFRSKFSKKEALPTPEEDKSLVDEEESLLTQDLSRRDFSKLMAVTAAEVAVPVAKSSAPDTLRAVISPKKKDADGVEVSPKNPSHK